MSQEKQVIWNLNYIPEKSISTTDIYGSTPIEIPEDFQFINFRPPIPGEYYLTRFTNIVELCYGKFNHNEPRLILEKKPKPTPKKVYKFTEIGEIRRARQGEYYKNLNGFLCCEARMTDNEYPIYKMEMEEI